MYECRSLCRGGMIQLAPQRVKLAPARPDAAHALFYIRPKPRRTGTMAMTEKPALPHKWLNKAWLIAPRCRRRRNEHAQTTMLETSPTPRAPLAPPKYRPGTATRAHMVVIKGRLLEVARAPDLLVTCRPAARRSNRHAAISISHEVREPRHARLELQDHLA